MIDAAVAEIEDNGIDISVRRIADRLGVPRPVVYRHFADRADLDEQIRRRVLESLLAELMPTLHPDGTVQAAVGAAIGAYLGWIERHPRLHHFLAARRDGPSAGLSDARHQIGGALAHLFEAAMAQHGVDTAPARPMAFGHIGLVDSVVNSWRADPASPLTSDQVAAMLVESVLVLIEGNARVWGVPVTRDTLIADILG
ncbi:MAG: TetR/AcrR family transcriptional regulator [Mycobacteriaceae bacterium]|nr:TetR/AcrR family transcriptional regulator [Mycobacteriaceae bacterium]